VDWAAVLGRGQRVELPTYAFRHQRYWPQPVPVAYGTGSGTPAETRFWAAVDDGDTRGLAATLGLEDERVGDLLPALASWRRCEQAEAATASWRYQVAWMPVAGPGPAPLSGTWLVISPAGQDQDVTGACVRALAAHGSDVKIAETAPGEADREVLADLIRQALGDSAGISGVSGIVSLLAFDEEPLAACPAVPGGLAATVGLVQALGEAGIGAPLWVLTRGAAWWTCRRPGTSGPPGGCATCWPGSGKTRSRSGPRDCGPGGWCVPGRPTAIGGGGCRAGRCWSPEGPGWSAGMLRDGSPAGVRPG
jgi:hypothetical protein